MPQLETRRLETWTTCCWRYKDVTFFFTATASPMSAILSKTVLRNARAVARIHKVVSSKRGRNNRFWVNCPFRASQRESAPAAVCQHISSVAASSALALPHFSSLERAERQSLFFFSSVMQILIITSLRRQPRTHESVQVGCAARPCTTWLTAARGRSYLSVVVFLNVEPKFECRSK